MAGVLAITQKFDAGGWAMPLPAPIRALPRVTRDWGAIGVEDRKDAEPWQNFIARIAPREPANLARKDLRRLANEIWDYPELEDCVPGLMEHCAFIAKRTLDRRLARAYWNRFRLGVPMFAELGRYCALWQHRLGSPWVELCNSIPLWDCELGPAALGKRLLRADDRTNLLQQSSLRLQDLQGGFIDAAFGALLASLASQPNSQKPVALAQDEGSELVELGNSLADGAVKANVAILAYVLLKPWTTREPEDGYRDRIITLLLERFGDPRTSQNVWDTQADLLARIHGLADAKDVFRVFNQWITEKTVRLFFDLIARTTDRPDQWKERRAFWEAFLDNKFVERAWFALGQDARGLAEIAESSHGLLFGRVGGNGAASSQSVLFMKIGDLVIAEWSDNGRARFWRDDSTFAPKFNKNYYEGQTLRSMYGGPGFEALAHQGKWYRKFADHIEIMTRIPYKGPRPVVLWGW